eukprot:CAMPEP_0204317924 /NCGR_PEP_ID=MMETSP0469-20131031/6243_1 /ASSEMBLY_ACC=CAM_ASM_000384 /TAXON_ID=2969 /ORGANISM="Oxyrrhis marina" /LENGTH=111 /DNA_ID=CAMNT_0051298899 /DNA_START=85 /DNA_END=420 /DNA_ORIENTATION=-
MRAVLMLLTLSLGIRVDSMEESAAMLVTHSGVAMATAADTSDESATDDSGLPCADGSQCRVDKDYMPDQCQNTGVRLQCPNMCNACKSPGAVGMMGGGGYYHTTRAPVTLR